MKAFITGITGFAGTYLANHLRASGDAVLGSTQVGDAGTVAWELSQPFSPTALDQITRFDPTVIYHLAAISKAEDCGKQAPTPQAIAVNVGGTERVLQLAASLPSRPRVVFISSSYVYPPSDTLTPVTEATTPAPAGGYGQSKLAAEDLICRSVQQGKVDAVIARAFQHTGPGQIPRFMLPEWCEQFARNVTPVVIHNSEVWIDLADVRDVVRAYRLLALHGASGEAYNVGSGCAYRTGEIFERLRAIAAPARVYEVRSTQPKRGPIADIAKISAGCGWRPQIALEQTISDTLAAFRTIAKQGSA